MLPSPGKDFIRIFNEFPDITSILFIVDGARDSIFFVMPCITAEILGSVIFNNGNTLCIAFIHRSHLEDLIVPERPNLSIV